MKPRLLFHNCRANNFRRGLPLKVGTSSWKSCHRCTQPFVFKSRHVTFKFLSRAERDSKLRTWWLSQLETALHFPYPSFKRVVGSGTCATVSQYWGLSWSWCELEQAQSSQHVSSTFQTTATTASTARIVVYRYNSINRAHGCVSLALCCMPRPAGMRMQVQAAQRRAPLLTSKFGPMKITHSDQRKRHVAISNILNQMNYSNELDAKRTSKYSVNSFQH